MIPTRAQAFGAASLANPHCSPDTKAWIVVEVDAEELLADSEVVAGDETNLAPDPKKRSVRGTKVHEGKGRFAGLSA
jgi:hypothetical protein